MVDKLEIRRAVAETIVETVLWSPVRALQNGEKVELRSLGRLKIRKRGPRIARNPRRAGVTVAVPAKWVPYFEPGRDLKMLLNGTKTEG